MVDSPHERQDRARKDAERSFRMATGETITLGPTEEEPGEWVPTYYRMTFEDGVVEETTDLFQILKLVQTHWELRQKRLVNLLVEMADGFTVEVEATGRIRLGDVWVSFRETGDQWSKDILWFRRVRSHVRAFHAGGEGGQATPLPTHLHAYGFGFTSGEKGRRVFLLRADRTIEYEL